MWRLWIFVTDFGDTAVTIPLAFAVFAILAAYRQYRLTLGWAATIVSCAAAIGGLKIGLAACANCIAISGLASPSGHTAMSAAVYLSLAVILAGPLPIPWRRVMLGGAAGLVLAIAWSRIALRLHSPLEVAIGLLVGIAAFAAFRAALAQAALARHEAPRLAAAWLGGAALMLIALSHGTRWPAEQAIRGTAGLFQLLLPWCS